VSLVEQELLTLLEHMGSPLVLVRVCVNRSLVLCVCLKIVISLFVRSLLTIVLSVLRFTDFDYPFGICTLFLYLLVLLNTCNISFVVIK